MGSVDTAIPALRWGIIGITLRIIRQKQKLTSYRHRMDLNDVRERSTRVDLWFHSLHKMNCLDAISAGKHVLCEKPFTINAKETQEIIDAARAKGVFVMEGVYLSSRHVQMMPSSLSLITLPSCLDEVLSPLPGSTL